ncbi:hypothetical protein AAFF_G00202610 [Aldrovandia affinis]|uniref:Uncharacterized protein n=1 Tax=Aldrovandia affinis TaxID=143900 RepID=A0AAD7WVA1_9TELE|nr:hypothetical protein AAFF_G00202610 [Aldrovandia affinis]
MLRRKSTALFSETAAQVNRSLPLCRCHSCSGTDETAFAVHITCTGGSGSTDAPITKYNTETGTGESATAHPVTLPLSFADRFLCIFFNGHRLPSLSWLR